MRKEYFYFFSKNKTATYYIKNSKNWTKLTRNWTQFDCSRMAAKKSAN